MVIDNKQELQTKEYLQRLDIKTMKKDIQRLRDADTLAETERIVVTKTAKNEYGPKQNSQPENTVKKQNPEVKPRPVFIKQAAKPEQKTAPKQNLSDNNATDQLKVKIEEGNKKYASENEKQQIFLFESQLVQLKKQLQSVSDKKLSLASQRSNILTEKENSQRKLSSIIEAEKSALSEEQKQEIEKQRWAIEKDIANIENKINNIDQDHKKFKEEENTLKEKIATIDNSLKNIHSSVKKIADQEIKNKQDVSELQEEYLKGFQPSATIAKEKSTESLKKEEQQRSEFMKEVEKWASSSKSE